MLRLARAASRGRSLPVARRLLPFARTSESRELGTSATAPPPAPAPPSDFLGQVCFVTGSARGIGKVCAEQFALRGGRVVVHYKSDRAAAEATLAALPLHPDAGGPHVVRQGAVECPDTCKRLVDSIVDETGRLDVLVNCAGYGRAGGWARERQREVQHVCL